MRVLRTFLKIVVGDGHSGICDEVNRQQRLNASDG